MRSRNIKTPAIICLAFGMTFLACATSPRYSRYGSDGMPRPSSGVKTVGGRAGIRHKKNVSAGKKRVEATTPPSASSGRFVPIATGKASYYGAKFHGRKTANGERFNMHALTAAHRKLPFGTRVRVTNLSNNRSVVVRINDRGPFVGNRVIDLSLAAAKRIGMVESGTARVRLEVAQ